MKIRREAHVPHPLAKIEPSETELNPACHAKRSRKHARAQRLHGGNKSGMVFVECIMDKYDAPIDLILSVTYGRAFQSNKDDVRLRISRLWAPAGFAAFWDVLRMLIASPHGFRWSARARGA